jgi:capsular polysaccharide biosynthesis protein
VESIKERTTNVIVRKEQPQSPGVPTESKEDRSNSDAVPEAKVDSPPPDIDRLSTLWRARYLILLAVVVMGAAVYVISGATSPVYTSSATIGITAASTPGGNAQDVALASNDIAAQDAQLVKDDGVLTKASKALGVSVSTLSSHVSAGTLASQNIVQITVQSSHPALAQRWAHGIALAFQSYVLEKAQASSTSLQNSVEVQAAPLNQQISLLQLAISAASSAAPGSAAFVVLQSDESQLTGLVASRAALTESTALAIASQHPNVDILQSGTAPSKISPRPLFYGSLAALATLFVAAQLAIVAARRRGRRS